MESSSSDNQQLIDEIYTEWYNLIADRVHVDDEFEIDLGADTVTKLKETLADLVNVCTIHFIKLSLYQRALEAKIDMSKPTPPVGFTDGKMRHSLG